MGVESETVMMAQAGEEPATATTAQAVTVMMAQAGEEPATVTMAQAVTVMMAQAEEELATATTAQAVTVMMAQAEEEPATALMAQVSVHQVMIGMIFFVQRVSLLSEVEMFNNITNFLHSFFSLIFQYVISPVLRPI